MLKKCSSCGEGYEVIFLKRILRKNGCLAATVFTDVNGRRVYGATCFDCQQVIARRSAKNAQERRLKRRIARRRGADRAARELKEKSCISCEKKEAVSFFKFKKYKAGKVGHSYTYWYKSIESGRMWYQNKCPDCALDGSRAAKGHTSRDDSVRPQTVAAVGAERAAESLFLRLGFSVDRVKRAIGPDLVCMIGEMKWTVEVKRATYNSRSWRVGVVRPARLNDDLVAIVLPNGRVYIDSMGNHKGLTQKNGSRTVTAIVKEFGLA